jgi:hypothetical protein
MKSELRLIDATWGPKVNILHVICLRCVRWVDHPANKWQVRCDKCGEVSNLGDMREVYRKRWRHND